MNKQNLQFQIILKSDNGYKKLASTTLQNKPSKGDYYTILPTKKTYKILDIIFEDLNTILIVKNADKYSNIISLIYDS